MPTIIFEADFSELVYDDSSFVRATLTIASMSTSPAQAVPDAPDPFCMPASLRSRAATDGTPISTSHFFVPVSTETVTGTFMPSKSDVFSLIALITSMMLTPSGPIAGPSGGPADALPPVTRADTFWTSAMGGGPDPKI